MSNKVRLKKEMPLFYRFLLSQDAVLKYLESIKDRDMSYITSIYDHDRGFIISYSCWKGGQEYWLTLACSWRAYCEQNI